MAHAYTPGLRVAELTVLAKERRLPIKGEVLVKQGDVVTSDTVVARTHLPGNVQLDERREQARRPARGPSDGDAEAGRATSIEKGEAIAETQGFFGLFKSTVRRALHRHASRASRRSPGRCILREPPIPVEIDAYVDGKVVEDHRGEGVVVETYGSFIQGIFGMGGETTGEITIVVDDAGPASRPSRSRRIVRRARSSSAARTSRGTLCRRPSQVRRAGVVVGGFDDPDLRRLLGYDLGVAITGHEDIGIDPRSDRGLRRDRDGPATFELLKSREGRKASINGATQIRAGVIRPEIVIPLDSSTDRWPTSNT